MVKQLNSNGKNQKKESQERDQNHQNAKNVELFGKDQNQNVLSVKLNYLNLISRNSRNQKENLKKKKMIHLQVVLHLKMKEKRKKNQRKSQNSKNQNVLVAKKNYHSSGVDMVIDMDLKVIEENVKKKMLKN